MHPDTLSSDIHFHDHLFWSHLTIHATYKQLSSQVGLCFIVAVLNSLVADDEHFTTSKSQSHYVCSLENELQFVENRQFLVASLQIWLKLLNLSSQQQRKKDFGGQHRAHNLSQACIPQSGNEENFTS